MTEEQNSGTESPGKEEQDSSPIFDEFQALGQELAAAFKTLWDHQDSRRLRQELHEGFTELGRQIDTAIQSAQESEAAQQFGVQIKETVERARESDIASKVEEGVLTGLRELNTQISKFVRSVEPSDAAQEGPEVDPETEAEV